jgi:hypothetical protein
MDVLDHHDRRSQRPCHQFEEEGEDLVTILTSQGVAQRRLVEHHVPDRAERPGGEEIVTSTPEHMGVVEMGLTEGAYCRRLPDPGLAPHQNCAPAALPSGREEAIEVL